MHRTTVRALAAATLTITLLAPAVPAAAAPTSDGWVVSWLDAIAGWLMPHQRASDRGEALPDIDPNGVDSGATHEDCGEAYPNIDPNGITAVSDPESEEDT